MFHDYYNKLFLNGSRRKAFWDLARQREKIRFGIKGNVINYDNICFLFY
jgi:hypothetical protein